MSESANKYLSPEQVCEIIPGMTKGALAQLRYNGRGPQYRKPTPRTVVYRESDIIDWIESNVFERTDKPMPGGVNK